MALAIEFPQVVWSIEFGGDETVVRQVTMTGGGGAGGGGVTVHNDLTGRSDPDTHPISSITGLSAALAAAGNVDSVNGQTGTVSLDLDDLTDVDTTTDPPDADDVLAWDGVTWTPATLAALGAPGLSNANPADLGTAAPGVATEASRADHVHDLPSAADVGADALGSTGTTFVYIWLGLPIESFGGSFTGPNTASIPPAAAYGTGLLALLTSQTDAGNNDVWEHTGSGNFTRVVPSLVGADKVGTLIVAQGDIGGTPRVGRVTAVGVVEVLVVDEAAIQALIDATTNLIESDVTTLQGDVTTLQGEQIPESLLDAKGDLIVATAADTAARLAVGSDGQVLTADAAASGGVKWAAPSGGTLLASQGSGSVVTATTLTTLLGSAPTITAAVGDHIQLVIGGRWNNQSGSAKNFTVAVTLGGSTIISSSAVANISSGVPDKVWRLAVDLVVVSTSSVVAVADGAIGTSIFNVVAGSVGGDITAGLVLDVLGSVQSGGSQEIQAILVGVDRDTP